MIKRFHEITIGDVVTLDATKSASVLKKYWFIPLFLCRKELESLAKEIFESIGGKTVFNLQDEFDKIGQYRKLQIYEALYKAVQIEFGLKAKINAWKLILQKDYKESPQLEKVLDEVKKYTGIQIETPDNLKEFETFIQHKIDKYAEMYPIEEIEEKETTNLSKIIYSVFNFMNEPYNEGMRLITFIELKAMAEDRIKSQKPENNEQYE